MTTKQYVREEYYFGKYQRFITIAILILTFQLPFFTVVGVIGFGLATMNSAIIAMAGFLIIFTYPVTKSQLYVSLVRKYIVPTAYFKNFYRIFEQDIPENEKSLFCFHPHGVLSYGMVANMNCGNDKMTNMIGLASRFIYNVPTLGFTLRLFGVQTVDPVNLNRLMGQGKTVGLIPGGFQEATLTTPKQLRIFIKHRYGFIKYALKYGYTIYPTIILNQHQQFSTFDYFLKLRWFINKLKFPAVCFMSRWWLFLNPDFQMITVIGKGIKLDKASQTKQVHKDQIHELHQKYVKQLQRLYEKYKHLNGNVPLKIY